MMKSWSTAKIAGTPEKKLPLSARIQAKLSTPSSASKTNKAMPSSPIYVITTLPDETFQKRRTQVKDKAIVHEVKLNRRLILDSPTKKVEPKRDPILQNNGEKVIEPPRVTVALERSNKKPSRDDTFVRSKKVGDFNYNINPPNQEPKVEGIRAFTINSPECRDERISRMAENKRSRAKSTEHGRNPITEGDENNRKFALKAVQTADQSGDSKWLNERRHLLKSERGYSSSNLHLATTVTLGDDCEYQSLTERNRSRTPQRPVSAMVQKMRGTAKGILEYDSGPSFREEKMSEKCTTIKFSDLRKSLETERVFARLQSIS